MKRFIGFGLVVLILLGAFFVQAQRECSENLTRVECDVYETAVQNLADSGDLYFTYALSVRVYLDTNQERSLAFAGDGKLERNRNGEVVWLGLDGFMNANNQDYFNPDDRLRYVPTVALVFAENEVSYAFNYELGVRYETDLETMEMESFFPSLDLQISEVFAKPLDSGSTMYQFSFPSGRTDSPFMPFFKLMMGDEAQGNGFYEGSILIDIQEEEIIGTVFNAVEFVDGEAYGQSFPVRRTSQFILSFVDEEPELALDFIVVDEQEDEDNLFEEAAQYGPMALLIAAAAGPLEEIFPPIAQNPALSGGLNIGGMGNNNPTPTATATPYLTPTPYPTFTPIPLTPNAEGYPCSANIIEGDETFFDVVYNQPNTSNPPVRALRPAQEITLEEAVDTEDGRWYRLSLNGAPFGYIQEEYIVLGEDCPN